MPQKEELQSGSCLPVLEQRVGGAAHEAQEEQSLCLLPTSKIARAGESGAGSAKVVRTK